MNYTLHHGDNREVLRTMPDNSVDSIVTDPPYELGFMGKKWDSTGIAYDETLWAECLRVLKPGGHLIAFGGTRTYHRMTVAIEDAGFEIRDCIMWLYASGFPKSLDVSKALDKQAGAAREVVGFGDLQRASQSRPYGQGTTQSLDIDSRTLTAPATPLAQQWQGWGTALKPAHEPIVVARKPLQGTVADNVQAWGVGALNIDGCRVGTDDNLERISGNTRSIYGDYSQKQTTPQPIGRWPANVILDEEAAQMLDEQSGVRKSGARKGANNINSLNGAYEGGWSYTGGPCEASSGGASRFFYVAKASRAEREAGLDVMEMQIAQSTRMSGDGMPLRQNGTERKTPIRANHHPTVKPITLMRYLVRLVTPPGGTVLDPFMGSGSTGCAAMLEGVDFVGIELSAEYLEIAERRIAHHAEQNPMGL